MADETRLKVTAQKLSGACCEDFTGPSLPSYACPDCSAAMMRSGRYWWCPECTTAVVATSAGEVWCLARPLESLALVLGDTVQELRAAQGGDQQPQARGEASDGQPKGDADA